MRGLFYCQNDDSLVVYFVINTFNLVTSAIPIGAVLLFMVTSTSWAAPDSEYADTRTIARNSISDSLVHGRFRALIIGNNNYQHNDSWKELKTAVPGATQLAKELEKEYGFSDIRVVTDATYRQTVQALSDLIASSQWNDNVIVYYAGHGFKNQKTGEAYWVPVDAEGTDDSLFVSNARIREKIAALSDIVQHVLLISDSCFSGALIRGYSGPGEIAPNYIEKVTKRRSVHILTAGGIEYVDDNFRNSGHSPFTYFLLKELIDNDKRYLTFSDLGRDIKKRVGDVAQQTPEDGILPGTRHEGGEFVLVKFSLVAANKINRPEENTSLPMPSSQTPVLSDPPAPTPEKFNRIVPFITM